jgi:hypothetical protein
MLHAMAIDGKQRSRNAQSAPGPVGRGGQARSPVAALQSAYGNQVLLRWTSRAPTGGAMLQRKCSCAGGAAKCPECEDKEKEGTMQRKAAGPAAGVPPIVHDVLRSPGNPLDRGTREFMGPRFGQDFSQVRVHTDAKAAESARAVNALAYTAGRNIAFASGQYAPETETGRRLLAHELAHVVQQRGVSSGPLGICASDSAAERQAGTAATMAMKGGVLSGLDTQIEWIARQPAPEAAAGGEVAVQGGSAGADSSAGCTPAAGITNSTCSAYLDNAWWLPLPYVNNATCACKATPNVPTANCVRKFLQDRLAATSTLFKVGAASQKPFETLQPLTYQAFVQSILTPRIYQDHVDAYRSCCCPTGPAPYADWIGVTAIPFQPCSLVGWFIDHFGSCTGAPGSW